MHRKSVPLQIKSADDDTGTFTGLASVFDNLDAHGDIVRRGAFAKSIASATPIPLCWFHKSDDPRCFVGDVVSAEETAEGLSIVGKFDMDSEFGQAAFRTVKGRRIGGLSIGYAIRNAVKTAAGNELTDLELIEVSIVARGANDRALVSSVKSVDRRETLRERIARAQLQAKTKEGPEMGWHELDPLNNPVDAEMYKALTPSPKKLAEQGNVYIKDRDENLTKAREITELAKELGRDLTDAEATQVETHLKAAQDAAKGLEASNRTKSILSQLDAMAASSAPLSPMGPAPGADSHIALTGRHAKTMARTIVKALPRDVTGTKALAAGQQVTSTIVLPEVVETGRPAVSVLDLLPQRVVPPSYSFLRQSVRTLNAAPVAEGDEKPTSVVSVVAVENRLRVVAHVSEQINHYLLSDAVNLQRFVEDELVYGLRRALEAEIISGGGSGEHFTGILATSGINVPAFATDALTSIRSAYTILQGNGYEPGVVVLSALDWQAIELQAATANAVAYQGLPVDPQARRLWGVPVVLNQGLGNKVGLVIGKDAVTVDHDGQIEVKWSDAVGEDFTHNFVRCRVEGRFGVSVNQPAAVVKVATAA